jgi:hypothetical protein
MLTLCFRLDCQLLTACFRLVFDRRKHCGRMAWFIALCVMSLVARAESTRWTVTQSSGAPQVTERQITENESTIQRFRCEGANHAAFVELSGSATPSSLHDEFQASLKIRTNVPGIRFGLRIVLPDQMDPRTGKPLETIMRGSVTSTSEDWQTVTVSGSRSEFESHLRRVRAELHKSDIATRSAVATGLALLLEISPDATFLDIGDFEYGPVVSPPESFVSVNATGAKPADEAEPGFVPLKVELNRIMLADRPVILRFAPDHGEDIGMLQSLGLNAAWVPDYRNTERAAQLKDLGFAVIATPPHPEFEPGDFSRLLRALPPLDQLCPSASAWYTGTRVPPDQLSHLLSFSREIRSADRRFQRPHMADVTSAEGAASREIDLIGVGRHVVGRSASFGELRNDLFRRRRLAGQLAFPWTWIQTEPSGTQQHYRAADGSQLPLVEPEQILLQMHAAISAGCKGIGFWKTRRLDPTIAADQETLLTIELANMQLTLLEPFLAEGRVDGHLAVMSQRNTDTTSAPADEQPAWLQSALGGRRSNASTTTGQRPDGPDAAVISSGATMLILLTHWDEESQFVPTPMYHRTASLVVAASETASAWRITASGIEGLPREVTAGGLVVRLNDFDQHVAVVVSSDPELVRNLDHRILQQAPRAAAIQHELATLKLQRVTRTVAQISQITTPPVSASTLLDRAAKTLDNCHVSLQRSSFRDCIASAEKTMRLVRECQYLCWRQAVDSLDSPNASPHTISFATLPDHWSMLKRLRGRRPTETDNLIASGTFENARMLSEGGWQRERIQAKDWLTTSDVIREPGTSNSILRLASWQPTQASQGRPLTPNGTTPLVVKSPAVLAAAGDIIRVTGRVRLGRGITPGSDRPVLLFDSVLGPEHGLRLDFLSTIGKADVADQKAGRSRMILRDRYDREWMDFEIFREAKTAGPIQFSIALTTAAEIHLDDVSLTRLPAETIPEDTGPIRSVSRSKLP